MASDASLKCVLIKRWPVPLITNSLAFFMRATIEFANLIGVMISSSPKTNKVGDFIKCSLSLELKAIVASICLVNASFS